MTDNADSELSFDCSYTFTSDNEGITIGELQLSRGDVCRFNSDDRNHMMSAVEQSSGGTRLERVNSTFGETGRPYGAGAWSVETAGCLGLDYGLRPRGRQLRARHIQKARSRRLSQIAQLSQENRNVPWYRRRLALTKQPPM